MKTVTLRVDDSVYQMIKSAADGQKRNISNFVEFATIQYLVSTQYVADNEMEEILNDKELMQSLKDGFKKVKKGEYTIV